MKKVFRILVIVAIVVALGIVALTGCNSAVDREIKIGTPDGAPALSIGGIINGATVKYADKGISCDVVMSDAPNVISAKLTTGEYDLAILPTNVAAKAYKSGADIKILTVNTWGNLYIVGKGEEITDLSALKGKTVFLTAKAGVPTVVFKYLLASANIEFEESDKAIEGKVALQYKEATEIIPMLKKGVAEFAVLGEPAVTKASAKAGVKVVFDLQQGYKAVSASENLGFPQASLVVSGNFYKENKAFVNEFVKEIKKSAASISNQEFLDTLVENVVKTAPSTSLQGITAESATRCSVKIVDAVEVKDEVKSFLGVFGIEVDDNFFVD